MGWKNERRMWNLKHRYYLSMWFDGIGTPAHASNSSGHGAGQRQIKANLHAYQLGLLALCGLLLAITASSAIAQTNSVQSNSTQTDFNINTSDADQQAEYQRELDKWMLQAYEGNQDAQFKVGVLFTNTKFNTADHEQAVYWYKQAANQGHALAQFNLGHQYLIGQGVPRDEKIAMSWWLKAAQQDHALASFNVGRAYYLGIGLQEDHGLARYWFERAAQNKEPKSIEILEKLGWAKKGDYQVPDTPPPAATTQTASTISTTSTSSQNEVEDNASYRDGSLLVTDLPASDSSNSSPPLNTLTISSQANAADESPAVISTTPIEDDRQTIVSTHPLAIYTNPAERSVLITIIDNRDDLNIVENSSEWLIVTLDSGMPVWVHENFIEVNGKDGRVTGSNVNARSVPLIASGTVVGQLNKNEAVDVLDQQKEWYRVQSPKRFKGWAKVSDYNSKPTTIVETTVETTAQTRVQAESPAADVQTTPSNAQSSSDQSSSDEVAQADAQAEAAPEITESANVNEWLFAQDENNYTMQLASFDDPVKTAQFESNRTFRDNPQLKRLTSLRNGTLWTYFLYGNYNNREDVENAKKEINQKRAWIRTFGRLQEVRCLAWKQQIPAPSELNEYCIR